MFTNLNRLAWPATAAAILGSMPIHAAAGRPTDGIDFDRDVRPLLNAHCAACHGGVKKAGGLSFVARDEAVVEGDSGARAIVPGDPEASELLRRVASPDADERMPPPEHGRGLLPDEVAMLRDWIAAGAAWRNHWSFDPPREPIPPAVPDAAWPRTDFDAFVAARLAAEGLAPSPQAGPVEWLRRVSLDLVGLPPTVAEYDAFLAAGGGSGDADAHRRAREAVVDRLLASPHFGERWASLWLDLARYADTFGFEKDPTRTVWPWRDWVIRAFNDDMPFDQFTIRQLAGDLLPDGTTDDLVATAFHRNTQTNTEGGTDDEEFRVAAVIDRVNTTWTAWQATTFGCVQCHAHPYDPYPHEDYYRFLAYFDGTLDRDLGDEYPTLPVPPEPGPRAEVAGLVRRIEASRRDIDARGLALASAVADWEPLAIHGVAASGGSLDLVAPGTLAAGGTLPIGVRYDLDVELPVGTTAFRLSIDLDGGRGASPPQRGAVASHLTLTMPSRPEVAGDRAAPDGTGPADAKPPAGARPTDEPPEIPIAAVIPDMRDGPFDARASLSPDAAGFGGYPVLDRPRWCVFVLRDPADLPRDGRLRLSITQSAASNEGTQACTLRNFRLETSRDARWTDRTIHDPAWQRAVGTVREAEAALRQLDGPRVPVLREQETAARRATHLFVRGNRLDPGPAVVPAIPAAVGLPVPMPGDRLGMARWLTDRSNPLTARVLANRLWAGMFGQGIVETLEDFGSSGARPSHPELLDHLAVRLVRVHGWSIKSLLREIAVSATYGQTAAVTPDLLARDPQNRWLARGPRNRLTAEMVRDQALVWSGRFAPRLFGPPVFPPQPEGIWKTVYSGATWETSQGEDRYRRSIYTFVKRTAGYPALLTFDAPSRDACTARRFPTNTPLQALAALNDPMMIELAAGLAERMAGAGTTARERIAFGCRELTLATPPDAMVTALVALHDTAAGDPSDERAPLTVVATAILNLDAALVR